MCRVQASRGFPPHARRSFFERVHGLSILLVGLSPTLAELLMPLPAANPFSTMRASLWWYSSEELEDGVTYGGRSWLRRGGVGVFFFSAVFWEGRGGWEGERSVV